MALERVRAMVRESAATGGDPADEEYTPHPLNPHEDALDAFGLCIQNATSADANVKITRDSSDNMVFEDPVAGIYTLSQLASQLNFLLECQPVTPNTTYTVTRSAGKVILEEWKRTVGATKIKTIDYTYSGGRLSTEVRKVYDSAGTTILAQITWSYSYTGNLFTSATMVRNI